MIKSHASFVRTSKGIAIEPRAPATLPNLSVGIVGRVAVPGSAGITVGVVGLGATTLASTDSLRPYWLAVWLLAAVVAASAGAIMIIRASGAQAGFASARTVVACLLPSVFAGAVLTVVLWLSASQHAIPGTWLLLYGCALIHMGAVTSKSIAVLGSVFVSLSFVAFSLPESHQMAILGIGFGEAHILYALIVKRIGAGQVGKLY
jgi:hypothetical protein